LQWQRLRVLDTEIQDLILSAASAGTTDGDSLTLKALELERNTLLLKNESAWRQRSRQTWLKCGDSKTKYFHRFASSRRDKKHIKEIHDGNGILHKGQKDIKTTTINFYKPHFEHNSSANIQSSVLVASLFEHSVSVEDTLSLDQPCTL
jgi:hypothetical protein